MDATQHVYFYTGLIMDISVPVELQQASAPLGEQAMLKYSHFHSQRARGALRRALAATSSQSTAMQEAYDLALARFYMWAQTDAAVFLAIHSPTGAPQVPWRAALTRFTGVNPGAPRPDSAGRPSPTGYADRRLVLEAGAGALRLQAEGSPPVVDRALAYGIDAAQPVATFRRARARAVGAPCAGRPGRACTVPGQHPRVQPHASSDSVKHARRALASTGSAGCQA